MMKPAARYHITVKPALAPMRIPGRWAIARGDECVNCGRCIEACLYGVHEKRGDDARLMAPPQSDLCRNCFRCILECPVQTLEMSPSLPFARLGREPYGARVLQSIWQQAEDGRIPVSGGGYKGPFTGPGFDSMWTDMSEIVRPTRDGIHGRETVSTTVLLGRAPQYVDLEAPTVTPDPLEVPLPILFEVPKGKFPEEDLVSIVLAAQQLGTFVFLHPWRTTLFEGITSSIIPVRDAEADPPPGEYPMIELKEPSPGRIAQLYGHGRRLSARIALDGSAPERAVELARVGADLVHLVASDGETNRLRDAIRQVHGALVRAGIRDQVSLVLTGGIAMAEHVAKAILCGLDAVVVDWPLLIAMGCRACAETCETCPGQVPDRAWATQRIVNLIASWRDQLLEVLGAMGLREVRRLRGEVGRAMFVEDLDKDFRDFLSQPCPTEAAPGAPMRFEPPPAREVGGSFKNGLNLWKVRRADTCINCGVCVETCPYDVHVRPMGFRRVLPPRSDACIGEDCRRNDFFCVPKCPMEALSIEPSPTVDTLGDPRWTAPMILAAWRQSERGEPPVDWNVEWRKGNSGGGFDRLRFRFPERGLPDDADPGTDIDLNRRSEGGERIRIPVPWYGGGMSFGSIGIQTMLARVRAAKEWGTFISTGEGGYPEALRPYDEHIITQVATGLFGVREDTIRRVKIVEFKYAQGAKPGLGGHLLGDKNTDVVAQMREAVPKTSLFSPFPFHSVYSVEDHKKHVDWILATNPRALVSIKVSTPTDVDMVAIGSYYAGAHILQIDGGYGGTGAAPDIAKKNIAMPIEYAIPKVHRYLVNEGVRDQVAILASGGIRTAWDIAKIVALGADGVVLGTSELVAVNCVRCGNCERGRGCPIGIATTDGGLSALLAPEWGANRISNLFRAYYLELKTILRRLGIPHIRRLVGRADLLELEKDLPR
jgi:glutamate synthase domain-containing protein 2/NAD-dependent dihydropyrimidine dehydrogenase PreA subunit